jgi:tripartite-type tricarboxylate transporter receptor subunit TctC
MRRFYVLILMSVMIFGSGAQAADQFPVKPITYIVAAEAGSDADVLVRPLCQRVSALLGQPIVIVNKPGGAHTIAYREIHDAKPDGYTIGGGYVTITANKLQGLLPYDHEGFTVLGAFATYIPIIVGSTKTQRAFKTIEEVIKFAKANPGEVSLATSGVGQSWWIGTLAFQAGTGLKFNIIPQPGAGAFAISQVAGGHVDLGILALGAAKPQIDAGNARFLAVFGNRRAQPPYDKVPTLKEVGYDISWESPQTLLGPPKMPKDVVDKLAKVFEKVASEPEYQKIVVDRNANPLVLTPEKTVQFLNEQRKTCRTVMEKAGILKEK